MRILVTGAAGFIGHHFIEHLLKNTDWDIVALDKLSYASSGFDRLRDVKAYDDRRVHCLAASLDCALPTGVAQEIGEVDYIVHMAAETHVDNSISDPLPFVTSNVVGTFYLLEFARTLKTLKKLLYFSTDEVYGPAPAGFAFRETDRMSPTNPYSAAKAGGEMLCLGWANTYKLPIIITNTMNVYGERQHPEKFIPKVIQSVRAGITIPIHASPDRTQAGSRFYIHARNVASAVLFLLQAETPSRESWNIVGEREIDNLALARKIAAILNKPLQYELVDFHSSRPGHDLRYALDGSKLGALGWHVPMSFEEALRRTVEWVTAPENDRWLAQPVNAR